MRGSPERAESLCKRPGRRRAHVLARKALPGRPFRLMRPGQASFPSRRLMRPGQASFPSRRLMRPGQASFPSRPLPRGSVGDRSRRQAPWMGSCVSREAGGGKGSQATLGMGAKPRSPRKAKPRELIGTLISLGCQPAQHIREDASMPEVFALLGGVDSRAGRELHLRAIGAGGANLHIGAVRRADIITLAAVQPQFGGAGPIREFQRMHAHSHQVGAVDALETGGDHGAHA